jgi:AcrR family transcriptional regulator
MPRSLSSERRESYLKAALKLFVQNGVPNTSTAAIAKAAGSAAGTLFLYFPTKQDLINELVLKISVEQAESINSLLTPDLTARETFFTIWEGSIQWFLTHLDAFLYIHQVRDSGLIPDEVVDESQKHLQYYFQAIQKGLAEGRIQPYPLELIGSILYQDIVAVMNLIRHQSDPGQQAALMQSGFDIFWNGIQVRDSTHNEETS